MVLLRGFHLIEKRAVKFKCGSQMIKGLLEVLVVQVRLTQLSISRHKHEQIFPVHINKKFCQGKLLHPYLNNTSCVLAKSVLIKLLLSLQEFATDFVINVVIVLFFVRLVDVLIDVTVIGLNIYTLIIATDCGLIELVLLML